MSPKDIFHSLALSLLILLIGVSSGYGIGHFRAAKASFPEMLPIADLNPGIATIKLMKVEGGQLKGQVDGAKARLAYSSEKIMELDKGEEFSVPLAEIDLHLFYLKNQIPEDVHFIASGGGKYYYHVLDKRSLAIAPKNRVFFPSAEAAQKAGYLEPK